MYTFYNESTGAPPEPRDNHGIEGEGELTVAHGFTAVTGVTSGARCPNLRQRVTVLEEAPLHGEQQGYW